MATLFLKLGAIGFGGPAAHVDLLEQEVVAKRGWLARVGKGAVAGGEAAPAEG